MTELIDYLSSFEGKSPEETEEAWARWSPAWHTAHLGEIAALSHKGVVKYLQTLQRWEEQRRLWGISVPRHTQIIEAARAWAGPKDPSAAFVFQLGLESAVKVADAEAAGALLAMGEACVEGFRDELCDDEFEADLDCLVDGSWEARVSEVPVELVRGEISRRFWWWAFRATECTDLESVLGVDLLDQDPRAGLLLRSAGTGQAWWVMDGVIAECPEVTVDLTSTLAHLLDRERPLDRFEVWASGKANHAFMIQQGDAVYVQRARYMPSRAQAEVMCDAWIRGGQLPIEDTIRAQVGKRTKAIDPFAGPFRLTARWRRAQSTLREVGTFASPADLESFQEALYGAIGRREELKLTGMKRLG